LMMLLIEAATTGRMAGLQTCPMLRNNGGNNSE